MSSMKKSADKKVVLVLAAHPDDEVLGCGGMIQKHVSDGDDVFLCVVTDGSSTQYAGDAGKDKQKRKECLRSAALLGIKDVIWLELPDMRLDTVPHVELNKRIAEVVDTLKPSVMYAPSIGDLNRDHVALAESVEVIARPGRPRLKKVFSYEILSSSEWSRNNVFVPNVFVDIDKYLEKKVRAFMVYKTEVRDYPHPRSEEGIRILAKYRGLQAGMKSAESFQLMVDYER
jgi:LmbE family N-acetylglucosaminyl deacetylase